MDTHDPLEVFDAAVDRVLDGTVTDYRLFWRPKIEAIREEIEQILEEDV